MKDCRPVKKIYIIVGATERREKICEESIQAVLGFVDLLRVIITAVA